MAAVSAPAPGFMASAMDLESSGTGLNDETKVAEAPAPGFAADAPTHKVSDE